MTRRPPRLRAFSGNVSLGGLVEYFDVPIAVLRPHVASGDLVPDEQGRYSVSAVRDFMAEHPEVNQ